MLRPIALAAALAAALPAAAQDAPPRPLPLTEEIRATSTQALQDTLYDLYALQLAAHQEHWNVVGPDFHQLHEFYEELYGSLDEPIDDVGARLRSLGAPADARPAEIAAGSPHAFRQPAPGGLEPTIGTLLDGWDGARDRLYDRIEAVSDDPPTQDLLIGLTFMLDKQTWMLGAHLE